MDKLLGCVCRKCFDARPPQALSVRCGGAVEQRRRLAEEDGEVWVIRDLSKADVARYVRICDVLLIDRERQVGERSRRDEVQFCSTASGGQARLLPWCIDWEKMIWRGAAEADEGEDGVGWRRRRRPGLRRFDLLEEI